MAVEFRADVAIAPGATLRIRAIRVNTQAAGVIFPSQIQAMLRSTPANAFMFETTPVVTVALPIPTIAATFGTIPTLLNCLAQAVTRSIIITEQAPGVFTDANQEQTLSETPTPTNPTRLEIFLTTVPGGLTVLAPVRAPLVAEGVISTAALQLAQVPEGCSLATGACTLATTRDISLIYNVVGNPELGQIESATFIFTFSTTGRTTTQQVGCVQAQVRLVPLSTSILRARAEDTGDRRVIPRFIDPFQPAMPRDMVCVNSCTCNLKFPYVTGRDIYDTRLIIANTSADPYETPAQSGTVDLYFFGVDAPSPPRVTLPAIPAGQFFKGTLWPTMAPNFEGYIIAVANFQYCHGMALIFEGKTQVIQHGYTALVIPDPQQFGGRRQPGFPLFGTVTGTVVAGTLSGTVLLNDQFGERLVH